MPPRHRGAIGAAPYAAPRPFPCLLLAALVLTFPGAARASQDARPSPATTVAAVAFHLLPKHTLRESPPRPDPAADQAGADLQRARQAIDAGDLEEAIDTLRAVLAREPDRTAVRALLGSVLATAGHLEEALREFDRTLELDPASTTARCGRGTVLGSLGRHEEAIPDLERCWTLRPDRPGTARDLGLARLAAGRPAAAIEPLEQMARRWPERVVGHRLLAEALRLAGRPEDAARRAREGLDRHPGVPTLEHELALALAGAGHVDDAVDALRRATATRPAYLPALADLGRLLAARGDRVEACGVYRRALRQPPEDPRLWAELAMVYAELGLQDESRAAVERSLELGDDRPGTLLLEGEAALRSGNATLALRALDRGIEVAPGAAAIHYQRGLALDRLRRLDAALAEFRRVLELDPDRLDAVIQAARTALRQDRPAVALEILEPWRDAGSGEPAYLALLGRALLSAGAPHDAVEPLRTATGLDPDLPEAPYLLARAWIALGETERARAAMEQFRARSQRERESRGSLARRRLESLIVRGRVYVAEGRWEEAVEALERAREQAPESPEILEPLVLAYEASGRVEEAAIVRATLERLRRHPRPAPRIPRRAHPAPGPSPRAPCNHPA